MPRIRYTEGPDEVTVTPAGKAAFEATRLKWVDVDDADVAKQLIAQGWERESKSAKSEKE